MKFHKSVAAGFVLVLLAGCAGQQYRHFTTRTPLPDRSILILGFMGGRDRWDNDRQGVRKLALQLRSLNLPGVYVETVENRKRPLAMQLIRRSFDRNEDSVLDDEERNQVQVILYGKSFGGAAVLKLARELNKQSIPVLLTVQIDSVGRGDAIIPPNVARAANLFQRSGKFIRGEPEIRAVDPGKTTILGNFEYNYQKKQISLAGVPWYKKIFRVAHAKMDRDPEVWAKVQELILKEVTTRIERE